jgi:hypothetical protein
VVVAEAIDLPSVALRRTALLLVDEGGGRHAKLLGELRARGRAVGGLLVERDGDRRRAAALGEAADVDDVLVGAKANADLVAALKQLRRLHALTVDVDLAGADGVGGERARLEEAGCPEPLIDADAFLGAEDGVIGAGHVRE